MNELAQQMQVTTDPVEWAKMFMAVFGSHKQDITEEILAAWFLTYHNTVVNTK